MRSIAAVLSVFLLSIACGQALAADQPNILIIFSDDQGAADMGAYGNFVVRTPSLDAFAAQGMRFERAFTTEAICTPRCSSLYTGLYPLRHGAHRNHTQVYEGVRSLPHYFAPLGYRVALAGKTHFGPASAFPFEMLPKTGNSSTESEAMIAGYFDSADAELDGSSFLPVLRGETDSHRDYVFATHTTLGVRNSGDAFPHRSARSVHYKYILNLNPDGRLTNNVTEQGQGGWFSWLERDQDDAWAAQRVGHYQRRPREEIYDQCIGCLAACAHARL